MSFTDEDNIAWMEDEILPTVIEWYQRQWYQAKVRAYNDSISNKDITKQFRQTLTEVKKSQNAREAISFVLKTMNSTEAPNRLRHTFNEVATNVLYDVYGRVPKFKVHSPTLTTVVFTLLVECAKFLRTHFRLLGDGSEEANETVAQNIYEALCEEGLVGDVLYNAVTIDDIEVETEKSPKKEKEKKKTAKIIKEIPEESQEEEEEEAKSPEEKKSKAVETIVAAPAVHVVAQETIGRATAKTDDVDDLVARIETLGKDDPQRKALKKKLRALLLAMEE